jgi:hypothetical protein
MMTVSSEMEREEASSRGGWRGLPFTLGPTWLAYFFHEQKSHVDVKLKGAPHVIMNAVMTLVLLSRGWV